MHKQHAMLFDLFPKNILIKTRTIFRYFHSTLSITLTSAPRSINIKQSFSALKPFSHAAMSNGLPLAVVPLISHVRFDRSNEKHSCCRLVPSDKQAKRISIYLIEIKNRLRSILSTTVSVKIMYIYSCICIK